MQRQRRLTDEEQLIIDDWAALHPDNAALIAQLQNEEWIGKELSFFDKYDAVKSRTILEERLSTIDNNTTTPVHRIHFLRTAWFKYAAAVIILITGIAIYFSIHTSQSQTE